MNVISIESLGIVDADSIIYRVAYTSEEDTLDRAKDTLRAYIFENIFKPTRLSKYVFCFTGDTNHRKEVDSEYKANRSGLEKPKHFKELKQYAIEEYSGLVIQNYEADDVVVAIADRYSGSFVLIGIDKDAYQLAGLHFNFVKHEFKAVSPFDAQYNLAKQMLMGDSTDNIKGLPKIGDVKATKLLSDSDAPMYTVYEIYKDLDLLPDYFEQQLRLLRMNKDCTLGTQVEDYFYDFSNYKLEELIDEFNF